MSKEDIFAQEVERRRQAIQNIRAGLVDINAALEQISDLDETYKIEQQSFKDQLEPIYLETRHYRGDWPIVYDFAQVERFPFLNGDTDDDCNAYFRISRIIAGQDDGISPFFSEPTRTGGTPEVNRYREYPNENAQRTESLTQLQNYPDRSDEQDNCGYDVDDGMGGTIRVGAYCPGDTGVEKLKNALEPWRDNLVDLKVDLYNGTTALEDLIQDIIDEINTCLSLLPAIPTYPSPTPNPSGALQNSINALISYIQNEMTNILDPRRDDLNAQTDLLEKKFFGIVGLRLHQINGSFSKTNSLKEQKKDNLRLIEDNIKSIADINILRVKNS